MTGNVAAACALRLLLHTFVLPTVLFASCVVSAPEAPSAGPTGGVQLNDVLRRGDEPLNDVLRRGAISH